MKLRISETGVFWYGIYCEAVDTAQWESLSNVQRAPSTEGSHLISIPLLANQFHFAGMAFLTTPVNATPAPFGGTEAGMYTRVTQIVFLEPI